MIQRDQSLSPKDQRFILHRPVGEKRVGDFVNVVFPTGCIVCGFDEAASVLISGYDGVLGTQAADWENLGLDLRFVTHQHCERGQVLRALLLFRMAPRPTSGGCGDEEGHQAPGVRAATWKLGSKPSTSFPFFFLFSFWAPICTCLFMHRICAQKGVHPDANPSLRCIWAKKTPYWEVSVAEALSRNEARGPALRSPVEPATWKSSTQLLFNWNSTPDQEIKMQKAGGQRLSLGSRSRRNSEDLEARVTKHQWFSAVCCGTLGHSSVENRV